MEKKNIFPDGQFLAGLAAAAHNMNLPTPKKKYT